MAKIFNSELTKELTEGAKIQTSFDKVPNEIAEKVVPVMEVNPKLLKTIDYVKSASLTNSTSTNIYTTPTNRDFYIVSAEISMIKDVTATTDGLFMNTTINGVAVNLLGFPGITLTPAEGTATLNPCRPIKIDRGVNIALSSNTNVGNFKMFGTILGFHVDNPNA